MTIVKKLHFLFLTLILSFLISCEDTKAKDEAPAKIPIKVVLLSMFEPGEDEGDRLGEFQNWVERLPLDKSLPFPAGYRDLRYNEEMGVLGIVTGVGNTKTAVSVTSLGLDDRFDLTNAYWLVAGISGVDPHDAPTSSAVWADWVIDGDLSHEIDAREIPEGWTTGYIPLRKTEPYQKPFPKEREVIAIQMNPGLMNWAYQMTKDIELPDNDEISQMRSLYKGYPAATMKPKVMIGTQLAASTYWHGELLNDWANDWVEYWTEGEGNFVTSAMEEVGTWHSLERLDAMGLADKDRMLVLRTASNFTMQWPGITAYQSLSGEKLTGKGYSAYIPALESAYIVGSPVVKALVNGWNEYRDNIPK